MTSDEERRRHHEAIRAELGIVAPSGPRLPDPKDHDQHIAQNIVLITLENGGTVTPEDLTAAGWTLEDMRAVGLLVPKDELQRLPDNVVVLDTSRRRK